MNAPTHRLIDHDRAAIFEWSDRSGEHELRFDYAPNTQPRWIGSADDLAAETDRRSERALIDCIAQFGEARHESVALFHDDGSIEYIVEPGSTT